MECMYRYFNMPNDDWALPTNFQICHKNNMIIIVECLCRRWQLVHSIADSWEILTGDSSSAQWWVLWKFCDFNRSDSSCLPNSRFVEDSYDWSVMSSIVGPSLDSVLPKTILPMEVVMVSRYTSPVVSSFTTQLELTLKRPGFDTIPMDRGPTGIPWSTSTSSEVFKQATTLAKPQGCVGSLTSASVLASGGDLGGDGAFGGLGGGLVEIV